MVVGSVVGSPLVGLDVTPLPVGGSTVVELPLPELVTAVVESVPPETEVELEIESIPSVPASPDAPVTSSDGHPNAAPPKQTNTQLRDSLFTCVDRIRSNPRIGVLFCGGYVWEWAKVGWGPKGELGSETDASGFSTQLHFFAAHAPWTLAAPLAIDRTHPPTIGHTDVQAGCLRHAVG